jgi:hypothetical protein
MTTISVISVKPIKGMESIHTTAKSAEVPLWAVGDSWTYEEQWGEFTYYPDGSFYFRWFQNSTTTYTVTNTAGDNYTVKITSKNIQGSIAIGAFRWTFTPAIKYDRELQIQKKDLAEVHRIYESKGPVSLFVGKIRLPIPAQFQVYEKEMCTPPLTLMPFPLSPKTNGTLPLIDHTGYYKISLYWGLLPLLSRPEFRYSTGPFTYSCEMATIEVPAGTYDAYNVTILQNEGGKHDSWLSYYVPEIGNCVKRSIHMDWHNTEKPYCIQEMQLVSTTYTP